MNTTLAKVAKNKDRWPTSFQTQTTEQTAQLSVLPVISPHIVPCLLASFVRRFITLPFTKWSLYIRALSDSAPPGVRSRLIIHVRRRFPVSLWNVSTLRVTNFGMRDLMDWHGRSLHPPPAAVTFDVRSAANGLIKVRLTAPSTDQRWHLTR